MLVYKIFENVCLKLQSLSYYCAEHIDWDTFQPITMFFNDCAWYWDNKLCEIEVVD